VRHDAPKNHKNLSFQTADFNPAPPKQWAPHLALVILLASALVATACLAHWSRTTDRQIARQHRDGVRARLLAQSGLAYAHTLVSHYLSNPHSPSPWQDVALPTAPDTFDAFAKSTQRLLDHTLIINGQKTTATANDTKRILTVPRVTLDGGRCDTFTLVFQLHADNPAKIRVYSLASCRGTGRHLSCTFTIEPTSPRPDSQLVCPDTAPDAQGPAQHISSALQEDSTKRVSFMLSVWGSHYSSQPANEHTNQPGAAC